MFSRKNNVLFHYIHRYDYECYKIWITQYITKKIVPKIYIQDFREISKKNVIKIPLRNELKH